MSETKFTKRPWHIDYHAVSDKPYQYQLVKYPQQESPDEAEANACLMTAAPELYELAEEVLRVWNEDGDNGEVQMKTPIAWHRVIRRAEAALAKARGE